MIDNHSHHDLKVVVEEGPTPDFVLQECPGSPVIPSFLVGRMWDKSTWHDSEVDSAGTRTDSKVVELPSRWAKTPGTPGVRKWAHVDLNHGPHISYKARPVELTGFEPVTPSLRKMQSNHSDQGKRPPIPGLWSVCGASVVRHRETWS